MSTVMTWPAQAESWLDERGRPAWIVATVLGFIVFWPIGLGLLAYMVLSKRLSGGCGRRQHRVRGFRSSGNTAFDSYKAETLRRLQDEQAAFEEFLGRLREAKDKTEFDQFMDERARRARSGEGPDEERAPA